MNTLTTCSHEILQRQVNNMTLPTWYLASNCIRVNVVILKAAITYEHFYNLINTYCLHNINASKTSRDTSLHTSSTTVQFQTHTFSQKIITAVSFIVNISFLCLQLITVCGCVYHIQCIYLFDHVLNTKLWNTGLAPDLHGHNHCISRCVSVF